VSLRYDEIAEILKIIDSSSCDEVIVETGDVKLIVRRNGAAGAAAAASANPVSAAPAVIVASQVSETATQIPRVEAAAGQIAITAPMVGTFYRAPSPDAPPFVEVGSTVERGQPICLIEVMKLFTTINAEAAGRIVEIGAENGELVEYGRTLFVIETL
jgi:acetyl-CoA carboxylase biotin carboxyl carrier protein